MKSKSTTFAAAVMLATLAIGAGPAQAALQAVGPTSAVTTIPTYYQDLSGRALAPCLDQSLQGFCVLTPEFDPLQTANPLPITTTGPINDTNFPNEIFYFLADSKMVVQGPGGGDTAVLRLALEASFLPAAPPPAPIVAPGNGSTFLRINLKKMSGLTPSSSFTVTHPYGTFQFTTDVDGNTNLGLAGQAFRVQDPFAGAIPGVFFPAGLQAATNTHIGPFLVSAGGPVTDAVTGNKYLGNSLLPTAVTGSPAGNNFFRIDGPDIGGPGVDTIQTPLFTLSGKIVGFILTPAVGGDFGVWKLGAASTPKTFALQNLSGEPVVPVITATVPNSNPVVASPDFTIAASAVTPCGPTLAAGASCNFDVVFNTASNGAKSATITASDGTAVGGVPAPAIPPVQTTVTGTGDGTPPAVALTGIITMTKTTSQTISGTVSDASGVTAVQVSVNGGAPQAATVGSGTWSLDVTGLTPNAANSIAVTAFDAALPAPGNQSTPVTGTITVDTIAPDTVAVDAVASPTKLASQAITGTAHDANGISSVAVSNNGTVQGTATVNGSTWSYDLTGMTNGNNVITATATDPAGNSTASASRTIAVDTIAPVVAINAVTSPTNLATQTITGTASDAGGISSVSISLNGAVQGNATITGGTWSFDLSGMTPNSTNTVTATATDTVGNTATSASKTINYSLGTITINNGASYTVSTHVTLALGYFPTPPKMQFSFDNVTWKPPVAFAASSPMILPAGDGNKTVHVRYLDQNNIVLNLIDVSATIFLDTKAPTGTIAINNKAPYTNNRTVALTIIGADVGTGVGSVCVKESATAVSCAPGDFVPFASPMGFDLSLGDGKKTVRAILKDNAGKTSTPIVAHITLDTTAPTGSIVSATVGKPAPATPLVTPVTLKLAALKASTMEISSDGGVTFNAPVKFVLSKKISLATGSGSHDIVVRFTDLAGNLFTTAPFNVTVP